MSHVSRIKIRWSTPLALQITLQIVYVGFAINMSAQPRPLIWLGALIASHLALDYLSRRFLPPNVYRSHELAPNSAHGIEFVRLSTIAATVSLFVNLESFSYLYLGIAGSLIFISKYLFIGPDGRHVYNPSAIASVIAVSVFPHQLSYGGTSWGDFWPIYSLALPIAIMVSYFAGSLWISVSYLASFSIVSLLHFFGFGWLGLKSTWEIESLGPFFWTATLASLGSMIFTFNIITDPQTSPRTRSEQFVFGAMIGSADFILRTRLVIMPDLLAYVFTQSLWLVKNWIASGSRFASLSMSIKSSPKKAQR